MTHTETPPGHAGPSGAGGGQTDQNSLPNTQPSSNPPSPLQPIFGAIPKELRERPQWMVFRYKYTVGNPKPKKPPYSALTGMKADPTNPDNWSTFDEVKAAYQRGGYAGIGYVISADDPFTCIDLDDTHGNADALAEQKGLVEALDSYTEISPSGNGAHVWVIGRVAKSVRRGFTEIYSAKRFMSVTGNVFGGHSAIRERQAQLLNLWDSLGTKSGGEPPLKTNGHSHPNRRTDAEIVVLSLKTELGVTLLGQNWSAYSTDASVATFALIGHLYPLANFDQDAVFRIVLGSPLGSRPDKYQSRPELLRDEIAKVAASYRPNTFDPWASRPPNVLSFEPPFAALTASRYVWHRVLQYGYLYALVGKWGHGKTALAVVIAIHAVLGRELAGHGMMASKVLYLSGENVGDVTLRIHAACRKLEIDPAILAGRLFFTQRPFPIDDAGALAQFVAEAATSGPFGLVVVDTAPAHSAAENENDNAQMAALAVALRSLMAGLGDPATVALVHPAKGAQRDNLEPRGGGAFSGSIDGELAVWMEGGLIELFRRDKFRGPGFDPMFFQLQRQEFPELVDNFGAPSISVIAYPIDAPPQAKAKAAPLTGARRIALEALTESQGQGVPPSEAVLEGHTKVNGAYAFAPFIVVHEDVWRARCYSNGISDGTAAAKKIAFRRARRDLLEKGLINTHADHYWIAEWCSTSKQFETGNYSEE